MLWSHISPVLTPVPTFPSSACSANVAMQQVWVAVKLGFGRGQGKGWGGGRPDLFSAQAAT